MKNSRPNRGEQMAKKLKIGSVVIVPWGVNRFVRAKVVDVWDDPDEHIRIQLELDYDEDEDPIVILVSSSRVTAA
jgi:hypothetical protein